MLTILDPNTFKNGAKLLLNMDIRKPADNLVRIGQNSVRSKRETQVTRSKSMSISNFFSRNSSDSISNVIERTQSTI